MSEERLLMTNITLHHLLFVYCVNSEVIVLDRVIFLRKRSYLRKIPWSKTINSKFTPMTSKKMVRSYYRLSNSPSSKNPIKKYKLFGGHISRAVCVRVIIFPLLYHENKQLH